MPECAKTRLQQCRVSKFSWGGPPDTPLQREGRDGKGQGRNGGWWGGEGLSTWAPPLETSSGSAPCLHSQQTLLVQQLDATHGLPSVRDNKEDDNGRFSTFSSFITSDHQQANALERVCSDVALGAECFSICHLVLFLDKMQFWSKIAIFPLPCIQCPVRFLRRISVTAVTLKS